MDDQTEVKLPESLEVVAYLAAIQAALTAGADSAWYAHPRDANRWRENEALAHACHPDYMKPILEHVSRVESALKARDAEIERLRGVVVETRRVLELENRKGAASAIRDTIWRGPAETLFDYLDAAIDQARAEGGEKEHG